MGISKWVFTAVMFLNIAWFGLAFHYFSIKAVSAARMLVPREQRESPLFATVVYSLRFLGGMNFAFALLALMMFVDIGKFHVQQQAWLTIALAVAHGTQFGFNVPIALRRTRQPGADRDGFVGPMRMIFRNDGILMLANAALGVSLLANS